MGGRIAISLALILCCCSCNSGVTIPLDQVWALRMPGTKNVHDLEPDHYGQSQQGLGEEEQIEHLTQSLSFQILQIIDQQTENSPTGPGFVVSGTGKQALSNVKEALDTKAPQTLPADSELTLFFYSREFGSYVHLNCVTRSENTITIEYAFVAHETKTTGLHFALVPLGKFPKGEYKVEIVNSPMDEGDNIRSQVKNVVCKPFSFSIT